MTIHTVAACTPRSWRQSVKIQQLLSMAYNKKQVVANKARTCIEAAQEAQKLINQSGHHHGIHNPFQQANRLLTSLQKDGKFLYDFATQQMKSFEEEETGQKEKMEALNLMKGKYEHKKRSLESRKSRMESDKRQEEVILSSAYSRKRTADHELQKAKDEVETMEQKFGKRFAAGTVGGTVTGILGGAGAGAGIGALIGIVGGPIGIPVGAIVGSIIGGTAGVGAGATGGSLATLKYLINKEEEAEEHAKKCQNDVKKAENNIFAAKRTLETLESEINDCESSIRKCSLEVKQAQNEVRKMKETIAFMKDAVHLWELFKNLSQDATSETEILQQIIQQAEQSKRYHIFTSDGGVSTLASSFLEAWEQVTMHHQKLAFSIADS